MTPCEECNNVANQMQQSMEGNWSNEGQAAVNQQRTKCNQMDQYCRQCREIPADLLTPVTMPTGNNNQQSSGQVSNGGVTGQGCQPDFTPCQNCLAEADKMQAVLSTGWFQEGQAAIDQQRQKCQQMDAYCQSCQEIPAELLQVVAMPANPNQQQQTNQQSGQSHQSGQTHQSGNFQQTGQSQQFTSSSSSGNCGNLQAQYEQCLTQVQNLNVNLNQANDPNQKNNIMSQINQKAQECNNYNQQHNECLAQANQQMASSGHSSGNSVQTIQPAVQVLPAPVEDNCAPNNAPCDQCWADRGKAQSELNKAWTQEGQDAVNQMGIACQEMQAKCNNPCLADAGS